MNYKITLHPEAIIELTASYQWYEERREGLGIRFMDAVGKGLHELSEHPERYVKKKNNYREIKIETFPYVIIYEVFKRKETVFVSYIFHTKRNPKLKYRR